jgi:translation initiation factor 6
MAHIYVTDFSGNPNIGLFAYATDSYCLVGQSVPEKNIEQIKDALKVPVYRLNIAGTSLLGVFLAGNDDILLVPSIAFDEEIRMLDQLDIRYEIIETKMTALGNNIVVNDKGILLSEELEKDVIDHVTSLFNLPVRKEIIVDQPTVGSCLLLTSKGGVIHKDASDEQIEDLSDFFGVTIDIGTVNRGVPQVSSGIIANKNGLLVGKLSSGVEVTNVDELLGFLGDNDE